ncbi:MAG: glycosyltransferase family 2 protein [Patescibacteria group bacterium]|nr:glycosyltransferase family 2 protein [Patescibacteria group bacterium]
MTKLSVNIITLNEEENIKTCLESIKDIAYEIIIVDSGSSDRTIEIAKKYTKKIFYRKFDDYSSQKNFALEKSSGEWILSLDADEEISQDLAKEIKQAIKKDNCNGFYISRKNILLGKVINHTRWSPDKHIWLFRKGFGKWVGEIHEEVLVDGNTLELSGSKIHHSYSTVTEFLAMTNDYTSKIALSEHKKGHRFSLFKLLIAFPRSFIGRYFMKMGFLDGWRGFVLSYMMGIYRMITVVKLWEISQKKLQKEKV